jgi:hypothetical protein
LESTSVTATTSFTSINSRTGLIAPDNNSKTFSLYATFNSSVTDTDQLEFTIRRTEADSTLGSIFERFDAGAATSPTLGNDNRIEVTATGLVFNQNTSDANQFEIMTPLPVVEALDSNGNVDFDANGSMTVLATGTLVPNPNIYALTNGISIFNAIVFSELASSVQLFAIGASLGAVNSALFDVNGPIIAIAVEDFDGTTPNWPYNTNVPTFDNGWRIDGYYGEIDSTNAAPLDSPSFSNTIFGENDLNDEDAISTTGFDKLTFEARDFSSFDDATLTFDWDVQGYLNNNDDAQYRLIYVDINQPFVFLLDGNGAISSAQGAVTVNIPNTVDKLQLQVRVRVRVRVRDNGNNGSSGFDNFKVTTLFDGLVYNNGWLPSAPSETTGSDNAYIFEGTYNVVGDIEVNNMFVGNSETVIIPATRSLSTNGGLINMGILQLNSVSTAYSSLIVNGVVEVDVIYKHHVNGIIGSKDLSAAPVFGQTFGDFAVVNTNIVKNPSHVSQKLFGPFNKVTGLYQIYDTDVPADANAILYALNNCMSNS